MRYIVAMLLVVVCARVEAQSQPPRPRPLKVAQPPEQQASAPAAQRERDIRGTKDAPFVIEALESKSDADEKADAGKHRKQEAANSRGTLYFTGLLALIALAQAALFVWQLILMQRSTAEAGKAADAAKAASESLQVAQRAWVSCIDVPVSRFQDARMIGFEDFEGERSGYMFRIRWRNAGQTPAIAMRAWCMGKVVLPPYAADLANVVAPADDGARQAPLIPGVAITSPPFHIFQGDYERLATRQCRAFIYGGVEYETVFEPSSKRTTTLCCEILFAGLAGNDRTPAFTFEVIGPHNLAT